MKRFIFHLFSSLFLISFLSGCETDIDVTAPWQDITIVYGLMSQNDSVHYVKINKAFLGDGNAYTYAQIIDSSSYGDKIEVTITEKASNGETRTFICEPTTIYDKEPGIFYYPDQIVYKSEFKIPSNYSSRDFTYYLNIRNKITEKLVTGSTKLISDFTMEKPRVDQNFVNFTSTSTQEIIWASASGGRRYDVIIRFWFEEIRNQNEVEQRYVEWNLGSIKSNDVNSGNRMQLSYSPQYFYTLCELQVPYSDASKENSVTSRMIKKAEFRLMVASDDLNTYSEVNEPSSGILQDKPEFTNINNGYGLYSSRYTKNFSIRIGDATEQPLFDKGLKFIDNPDN